ncbi:MAG: hypothetical protein FJ297_06650 [Planctomycetes bacterium]|nr:hypothetical protein [Planctomycetota bacterium]
MAFTKYYDLPEPAAGPACIFLRSKALYLHGEHRDPSRPEDGGSPYCWCNVTQHMLGPDQLHVNRAECVAGRDCFRSSY